MPLICERTLLDPTPRSQYLLTHQLIERLFIDSSNCPNLLPHVTKEEMYTKFCAKAYMEAQYLDLLDVPILQRGLFGELSKCYRHIFYSKKQLIDNFSPLINQLNFAVIWASRTSFVWTGWIELYRGRANLTTAVLSRIL